MRRIGAFLLTLISCLTLFNFGLEGNGANAATKVSLSDVYKAYAEELASTTTNAKSFGVKDINKDGIPEVLVNDSSAILSYKNDKSVWVWNSKVLSDMYYSEKTGNILYHHSYNNTDEWVIYAIDLDQGAGLVLVDSYTNNNGTYLRGGKSSSKSLVNAALDRLVPNKEILDTPYENSKENRDKYLSPVQLNKSKLTVYAGGAKSKLIVEGTESTITWSSSDKTIARVTKNGNVYGLKAGKCTIKAIIDGRSVKCEVTVKKIKLNKTSIALKPKATYQLKLNGVKEGIKWSTSKKSIVKVSKAGKITAVKKGTATIKATVNGVTYKCKVTVK